MLQEQKTGVGRAVRAALGREVASQAGEDRLGPLGPSEDFAIESELRGSCRGAGAEG